MSFHRSCCCSPTGLPCGYGFCSHLTATVTKWRQIFSTGCDQILDSITDYDVWFTSDNAKSPGAYVDATGALVPWTQFIFSGSLKFVAFKPDGSIFSQGVNPTTLEIAAADVPIRTVQGSVLADIHIIGGTLNSQNVPDAQHPVSLSLTCSGGSWDYFSDFSDCPMFQFNHTDVQIAIADNPTGSPGQTQSVFPALPPTGC